MKRSSAILALLACGAAGVVGAWAGARRVEQRFERIVAAHEKAQTLGSLLSPEQRAIVARAYTAAPGVDTPFDTIAWEPPKTPAPFVGYVPTPGSHANAQHNSLGWRDARELTQPKPPDVVRVFLTGGSTAYGVGAPSQETTIGALLEQRLNAARGASGGKRFEVFTVAAPAWTSTHERIAIENLIAESGPDVIVALTGVNDAHWGWRGANVMWMRTYADEYFRLLHDEALAAARRAPTRDVAPTDSMPVSPSDVGYRFERNQRLAWYAAVSAGASYVLCLQPCLHVTESSRRAPSDDEPDYFVACFDELRSRMVALSPKGWSFVDLTRLFDADHGSEHVYLDSYHFGDKGNRRIADALVESVRAAAAGAAETK